MRSSVRLWAARRGLMLPRLRRSLWVHGGTATEFLVSQRLVQSIMDARPHVGLVVTASRDDTVAFLGRSFPDEQDLSPPRPGAVGRWLRALQVRHLLLLDAGRSLPAGILRATVARGIPISAVNVADPLAVAPALLAAARETPAAVRLCVGDATVAAALVGVGVPAAVLVETGFLTGDGPVHAPAALLRRRCRLADDVPVAAALDVPASEESLVFAAFAAARGRRPGLRLLWEPRDLCRAAGIRRQAAARGWGVATPSALTRGRAGEWDLLVPAEPGEIVPLLPLAAVASVGGSHSADPCGTVAALAASAGLRTLVGPCRHFTDMPWRLLEGLPGMRPISTADLAAELAAPENREAAAPPGRASGNESARRTHDALRERLPESPALPAVAQDWRIPTWRDRCGGSRLWGTVSRPLARGRIDSWPELAARLGHPQILLCLGNGPSSEDPRLESLGHDCLIRVNWRWRDRGFLVHPQVVFVGDPTTIQKVDGAVFGFWNRALEQAMLLRHLLARGPRIMSHFTMERMSPLIRDGAWPARPTNGALMIAAAVAIAPARLIIAGVDLYRHPEGRHPGDLLGTNAYCRAHTRSTDLDIIRIALAGYRGEVTILGDALRAALGGSCEARHD